MASICRRWLGLLLVALVWSSRPGARAFSILPTMRMASSSSSSSSSSRQLSPPPPPPPPTKGAASTPLVKRKVAVLGAGGYFGALVFGFLQRAGSLYGTGLAGGGSSVRTIGATAETSLRLNRCLSKQFVLAFADESYVKLTNVLSSSEAIQERLQGWNALVLGNALTVQRRPVTLNTYEQTPNDQTYEIYWDAPRGQQQAAAVATSEDDSLSTTSAMKQQQQQQQQQKDVEDAVVETILKNVLQAAQQAGIQHIVAVNHRRQPQSPRLANIVAKNLPRHSLYLLVAQWSLDRSTGSLVYLSKGSADPACCDGRD